jgi:2-oxoglutarate ferredoxin oxidoreductase subunit delta
MPKPVFNEDRCKGCELCTTVCPKKIVVMAKHFNAKGYRPATVIETDKCIGCALCARMCPDVVIEIYKEKK